ncbi:MAG: hypothetical protein LUB59_04835 [Candidatus Gastranaerophilales bacterium]|nr:hypothetical protein [Candidatus Gastranaerophilales bacterium]
MTAPAYAGTVSLQTECPVYTIRDGATLTEEEQRAIDATIGYFLENPDVDRVVLDSRDFPSLSIEWYNAISEKLDFINEHYWYLKGNDQNYIYFENYITAATHSNTTYDYKSHQDHTTITVKNYMKDFQTLEIKKFVDYAYFLVPSLGIYDGMDEFEAIEILNNYVCDLMEYDLDYEAKYLSIFETHKGTCGDYALLFKALARGAGIEAYSIDSQTEEHSWNSVVIDGTEYEIDTCWNDMQYWDRHNIYLLSREKTANITCHKFVEYKE